MKLILKLFFMIFTASLVLALLAGALLVLIFSLLRWLITGQRPAVVSIMSTVNQWKKGPLWPQQTRDPDNTIDIEAKEVPQAVKPPSLPQK
jgi:MFS superfamily sulfate permease-like transporter